MIQYLDLNNQQIQPYQPHTKLTEDLFQKGLLNQEAINEFKKVHEILIDKIRYVKLVTPKNIEHMTYK